MTIIDTHAHIYPDAIALRAAQSIADFYEIPVCMDGTLSGLLARGDEAGISRFLVHSVAVTWERTHSVNDYIISAVRSCPQRLIGFGSIHPDHPDARSELQRIKDGGLRGIKLHPDFQKFELDGPKAMALFELMAEMNLPLLCHIGDKRYSFSQPQRMACVMEKIPTLKVIGAHFGGWSMWEDGWRHLAGRPNLWVDTCSSLYTLAPQQAADIIHHYGASRVFFASDYPMWDPVQELERFRALPLTPAEQEAILHLNFEQFLAGL